MLLKSENIVNDIASRNLNINSLYNWFIFVLYKK